MLRASKLAHLPKSKIEYLKNKKEKLTSEEEKKSSEEEAKKNVDINIVKIDFLSLDSPPKPETGDPTTCSKCKSYLNKYSKLEQSGTEYYWNCEFCGYKNVLLIDPHEIPKTDLVTYLIEKPATKTEAKEEIKLESDDISVVFCIDNSGSMAEKMPFSGKTKYSIDPNYISRLEAVKVAIDSQVQANVKQNPGRKLGIITFESQVIIYGDGSSPPMILPHRLQNDFFGVVEEVTNHSAKYMSAAVEKSAPQLLKILEPISPEGCTALGPAVVAASALAAQGKPGSKIIICTDGLANAGMGSITDRGADYSKIKEFYSKVGEYAKLHDIIVSVISLVGTECRLDLLCPLVDETNGDILRVDPRNLSSDFSELVSSKILATQVVVKVRVPQIMEFVDVPDKYLSDGKGLYVQDRGSVTAESSVTCKYSMKSLAELEKMDNIDFTKIESIPIQAITEYTSKDGSKWVRVITEMINCSSDYSEMKKNLNAEVISAHYAHTSAKMAKAGRYEDCLIFQDESAQLLAKKEDREKLEMKMGGMRKAVESQMAHNKDSEVQEDNLTCMAQSLFK